MLPDRQTPIKLNLTEDYKWEELDGQKFEDDKELAQFSFAIPVRTDYASIPDMHPVADLGIRMIPSEGEAMIHGPPTTVCLYTDGSFKDSKLGWGVVILAYRSYRKGDPGGGFSLICFSGVR